MALLPVSPPPFHLQQSNPLSLFTEYVLLNPCCVPDTALGCVNLMFLLPGIPALQRATELATLNLSPFKSFITPTVRPFLGPDL